jgi:hypothetical protein
LVTAKLASGLLVSALVRRAFEQGGFAAILQKGDETAGAILLIGREKGGIVGLWEQALTAKGAYAWSPCGPQDVENQSEIDHYMSRRRANDPDLWMIELDIPDPARFAAESVHSG